MAKFTTGWYNFTMAEDEKEKLSKIEDLKSKLFSRGYVPRIEHYEAYRKPTESVPDEWRHEPPKADKPIMKNSIFKKFFIFSIIIFALSMLYVMFSFFEGGNNVSNNNIDIAVLGNAFTNGGEDLPLIVEITNKNNVALELADLVLEAPRSSVATGNERQRISLGSIPAGGVRSENMTVRLFGEQGSIHDLKFSLEYRVPGSNAIFVKDKPYEVTIESTPINLIVEAPNEIPPNQEFNLRIKAGLNATEAVKNMIIKVDYPLGFQFVSAAPAPDLGNNVFELGNLAPGADYQVTITGKMVDVFDGEEKNFKIWSGSQSQSEKSEIETVFNSVAQIIQVNKPFVEANIYVNGEYAKEYAIGSRTSMAGDIRWANNLGEKINDLQIKVKISGNAVDRKTIKSSRGFYQSLDDTITWDKNSDPNLASIPPGDYGSASFSLSPKQLFTSAEGILNQPVITLEVSVSGKQALEGNKTKVIETHEVKVVRVVSDVGLGSKVVYSSGPFQNTGPVPPKVEQETTYTVIWNITNTSNIVRGGKVRTTLPPWVRYVGTVSPSSASLNYNANNKEIVWDVGTIARGAGILGDGPEVAFQIAFTPSLSQLDETPTLVNNTVLTGHDDFANVDVQANKSSLSTQLSGDASYDAKSGRVQE